MTYLFSLVLPFLAIWLLFWAEGGKGGYWHLAPIVGALIAVGYLAQDNTFFSGLVCAIYLGIIFSNCVKFAFFMLFGYKSIDFKFTAAEKTEEEEEVASE